MRGVLIGAVLVVLAGLIGLLRPPASTVPLALDNPHPDGAQALGALLREEGVRTTTVSSLGHALERASSSPTTIAVVGAGRLTAAERAELADSGADVTVIGALYQDLTGLRLTPVPVALTSSGASSTGPLTAACTDPDALAAGTVSAATGSVLVPAGAGTGCFPLPPAAGAPSAPDHAAGPYAYATARLSGGGTLRVLADATLVTNQSLAQEGNAALAVRSLGHHGEMVWLDASRTGLSRTVWDQVATPPWLPVALLQLGLSTCLLALAHGRRPGPLVTEELPVPVHALETTAGRGRLYQRARARGPVARSLRAGTGTRLGRRLGVPASAGTDALVQAVARACGRPGHTVRELLYGGEPASDRELVALARELEQLEKEVSAS